MKVAISMQTIILILCWPKLVPMLHIHSSQSLIYTQKYSKLTFQIYLPLRNDPHWQGLLQILAPILVKRNLRSFYRCLYLTAFQLTIQTSRVNKGASLRWLVFLGHFYVSFLASARRYWSALTDRWVCEFPYKEQTMLQSDGSKTSFIICNRVNNK